MSTDSDDRMAPAISSELFPKIKILLFLREADEQMKHLKLLSIIFLRVSSIGSLCDVWQLLFRIHAGKLTQS